MKPWEETWEADAEARHLHYNGANVLVPGGQIRLGEEHETWWEATEADVDRARLIAAAPEMARLLLELQDFEGAGCVACGHVSCGDETCKDHEPHSANCPIVAVLRKAGVLRHGD
jgi:hypothetical protein